MKTCKKYIYVVLLLILSNVAVHAGNGAITGLVFEDVYPYAPISNLFVVCYNFYSGEYVAMQSTQSNGTFYIDLPSGDYKVYAQPGNESMYIPEYYENTFDSFYAKKVNVSAGQTVTQINFGLTIGGIIEGSVLHVSDRTPISFMRIEAYDEMGDLLGYTTSLDNGRYYLHVPQGKYKLRAYDTRGRNYVTVFYDEDFINNEQVVIINNFDGINAYIVKVNKGYGTGYYNFFILEGIKVEGIVTGIDQSPVPNAIVWALATSGKNQLWTKTFSDGRYEIIVPEDSYWFYAECSNYFPQYYQKAYQPVDAIIVSVDHFIGDIDFQLDAENNIKYKLLDLITLLKFFTNFSINETLPISYYDQNNNSQLDMADMLKILDILINN
jgi:hypothetical protein